MNVLLPSPESNSLCFNELDNFCLSVFPARAVWQRAYSTLRLCAETTAGRMV
jgi:hypothetical protein